MLQTSSMSEFVSWGRQRLLVSWHNFLPNFDVWNCFRHFFDSIRCSKDCYGKFGLLGLLLISKKHDSGWQVTYVATPPPFNFTILLDRDDLKSPRVPILRLYTCTHVIVITMNRTCRHCYHAMCRLVWFCCVDAKYAFRICSASLLKAVRNHSSESQFCFTSFFADVVDHFWTHHRDR